MYGEVVASLFLSMLLAVSKAGYAQTEVKLTASDGRASSGFGYSVAVDGSTVAVGAPVGLFQAGSVLTFVREGGRWSERAKLTAPDGETVKGGKISERLWRSLETRWWSGLLAPTTRVVWVPAPPTSSCET
jgi:hypothetical protein